MTANDIRVELTVPQVLEILTISRKKLIAKKGEILDFDEWFLQTEESLRLMFIFPDLSQEHKREMKNLFLHELLNVEAHLPH